MKSACSALNVLAAQDAIYRIALGVEALLLNGIQFCVLDPIATDSFLHEKSAAVLTDLSSLEDQLQQVPEADGKDAMRALDGIKDCVMDLKDALVNLTQFQSKSLEDVREQIARVVSLRGEFVNEIQAMELTLGTPQHFFDVRPAQSADAMEAYLVSLDQVIGEAWLAQRAS